jgi:hypothetical protein
VAGPIPVHLVKLTPILARKGIMIMIKAAKIPGSRNTVYPLLREEPVRLTTPSLFNTLELVSTINLIFLPNLKGPEPNRMTAKVKGSAPKVRALPLI